MSEVHTVSCEKDNEAPAVATEGATEVSERPPTPCGRTDNLRRVPGPDNSNAIAAEVLNISATFNVIFNMI